MKTPSPTMRKILENAAGLANHRPSGRSQYGGWSESLVACHRNAWLVRSGEITPAGLEAIGVPLRIVLTVMDQEKHGFVAIAETSSMSAAVAAGLVASVDTLIDPDAEPGDDAAFAFILDLKTSNGDQIDTGKRMLTLQVAMSLAPEAVSHWLEERPEPDTVINRKPMRVQIERFPTTYTGGEHHG